MLMFAIRFFLHVVFMQQVRKQEEEKYERGMRGTTMALGLFTHLPGSNTQLKL